MRCVCEKALILFEGKGFIKNDRAAFTLLKPCRVLCMDRHDILRVNITNQRLNGCGIGVAACVQVDHANTFPLHKPKEPRNIIFLFIPIPHGLEQNAARK